MDRPIVPCHLVEIRSLSGPAPDTAVAHSGKPPLLTPLLMYLMTGSFGPPNSESPCAECCSDGHNTAGRLRDGGHGFLRRVCRGVRPATASFDFLYRVSQSRRDRPAAVAQGLVGPRPSVAAMTSPVQRVARAAREVVIGGFPGSGAIHSRDRVREFCEDGWAVPPSPPHRAGLRPARA